MRIVFAGTSAFAQAALQELIDGDFAPVAVYTRPDRRSGRGGRLAASPVKRLATERLGQDCPILTPEDFSAEDTIDGLRQLRPDLLLTCAYGLILPPPVLGLPQWAPVNVHASLLPRWRGAAPVRYAIAHRDSITGVCLAKMEPSLDSGALLASRELAIAPQQTYGELYQRLSDEAAALTVDFLAKLDAATPQARRELLTGHEQSPADVCYAPRLRAEQYAIDWQGSGKDIEAWVRALQPQPRARTFIDGELLIIHQAEFEPCRPDEAALRPASVCADSQALRIRCADGVICPRRVQLAGRAAVDIGAFINGRRLEPWFGRICEARACGGASGGGHRRIHQRPPP